MEPPGQSGRLFRLDAMDADSSLTACAAIGARRRSRPLFLRPVRAGRSCGRCLFALYAFNHEVARVAETVREPMLGAIRLEWWRETVEGAREGDAAQP